MFRRNGKPMSCEPCRRSKVRCDHTRPVCLKCQARKIEDQCHFHPSPMTKAQSQSSPVRPRPRHVVPRISQRGEADSMPSSFFSNPTPESTPGTHMLARSPEESTGPFYLGSTSYASAFRSLNSHPEDHRANDEAIIPMSPAGANFNARLGIDSIIAAKLGSSSLTMYERALKDYFASSTATALAGPLILMALSQIRVDLEVLSVRSKWDSICTEITENTARSLKIPPTCTPSTFHTLFTGPNLRWEIIGLVLSLAGFHAQFIPPDDPLFDLVDGRKLDKEEFIADMIQGSNSCIHVCQEYDCVNDLMIWLLYMNALLQSNFYGDNYHGVWRRMGDGVICAYAEGYHCEEPFDIPFFLRETRRRVFSAMYRSDKTMATFFGRPPLIAGRYCSRKMPFDLHETTLLTEDTSALNAALARLDSQGWNTDGVIYTATWLRLRYSTARFRERVLELSLAGETDPDLSEKLSGLSNENRLAWENLPQHMRYDVYKDACWDTLPPETCLRMLYVYLDHLNSEFQMQRLRRRHFPDATPHLLQISMQLLTYVLVLNKQRNRPYQLQRHYASIILFYCLPGAGVLALELRRCTLENKPLPGSIKRADLIRNLSILISLLEGVVYPGDGNHKLCAELNKMLALVLDEVLNYQPTSSAGSGDGMDQQLDQVTFFDIPMMEGMEPIPTESENFLNWLDNANWDNTYLT
ncbi:uncharacterized protein BDZ99DRAFT_442630 [Mytilinidion resinicola]|uniref:Zn(2)-C6 fungal-type domain-containing protein n=1 Tax=Mytilinidion resinicola TaxID=574789 RepID=A0A6A6YNK6_9PEZI|nr:uncharacterized protein BDZ99DRAFT_442630 [Mytilinidion resinicola]KAF2810118.1 hypothetical protein BDZ99DRAFT_442630 [Mytilinidion resinicola]